MRLIERVEARLAELTEADRRLIAVLLGDLPGVAAMTGREVAAQAGVHATTAGRLATRLGFSSYRALRRDLIREQDLAGRMRERLQGIGGGSILAAAVASEVEALTALPQQVTQAQIDLAVAMLAAARRILVFGTSHAGLPAALLARRLTRSGYPAGVLHHADWQAADALVDLGPGDVLVAFQFWRDTDSTSRLAGLVQARGGKVVLVSDGPARPVEPPPDVTLSVLRGGLGESRSLVAPVVLANVLVLELSRSDGGRSLAALARLRELREALAAPRPAKRTPRE